LDNRSVPVRFHAPDAERPGDVVHLPREEAEHLVRVLRLTAGTTVRVFNGRGGEFDATIDTANRSGAQVRVRVRREPQSEARVAVTLVQAVLKGDKMDGVVRDAVMMGVAAIQPVVTARSEVPLTSLRRGHRRERWLRIAVSSAKQSGRAVVPLVLEPRPFDEVTAALGDSFAASQVLMFVEPSAGALAISPGSLDLEPPGACAILTGPEGGWTPEEVARGCDIGTLVGLGSRTLRGDSVALVAMAALLTHWRAL
jgi:16S rRNA (uracil1498-N3)-methyltransferase